MIRGYSRAVLGLALGVLVVAAFGSGYAADSDMPRWDIDSICAGAADRACVREESVSRGTVFNRWLGEPIAARAACLSASDKAGARSYRALLACLEDRAVKSLEETPVQLPAPTSPAGEAASSARAG